MSIDTSAVIIVGLPTKELSEELVDEMSLAFPYFDGYSVAIAGFLYEETWDYSYKEIIFDDVKLNELKNKFRDLTNLDAKVYLSPNIT